MNSSGPAHEIISVWAKALAGVFINNTTNVKEIGVGIPGLSDFESGVFLMTVKGRYNNLYKRNIKKCLAADLNIDPCNLRFINDSTCFMQGEVFGGSGRGFKSSLD